MNNYLQEILENSGLTNKESSVYLALLACGEATVSDISKKTDLKRPIIYVIIEGLIKRGYSSQVPGKKINTYQAADPSILLNKLILTTKNFQEMLPVFRNFRNNSGKVPKISFHETKEGVLNVFDDMAKAKEVFFISSYVSIEKTFPGMIDKWVNNSNMLNAKQVARYLIPDTNEEIELVQRFIPNTRNTIRSSRELVGMSLDFTIYDNKLGITSLEDDVSIVVFKSKNIVDSFRFIFESLWEKGKDVKTLK